MVGVQPRGSVVAYRFQLLVEGEDLLVPRALGVFMVDRCVDADVEELVDGQLDVDLFREGSKRLSSRDPISVFNPLPLNEQDFQELSQAALILATNAKFDKQECSQERCLNYD